MFDLESYVLYQLAGHNVILHVSQNYGYINRMHTHQYDSVGFIFKG